MNNFEKLRNETSSIEGMAKLFCSPGWEGTGRVFSTHAAKYLENMDDAIQAEVDWLKSETKEMELDANGVESIEKHHCSLCGKYIEEDNISVCNRCASEYKF